MITKNRQQKLHSDQSGLVSIIVTLIIMLVISLIVIGFAKLVRRDQRQALDKQLNTQAFYAAETGINDAQKDIKAAIAINDPIPEKAQCARNLNGYFSSDNVIDSNLGVSYSCLLVDASPTTLEYGNVDVATSQVIPVIPKGPGVVSSLTISWQAKDGSTSFGCPGTGSYPSLPAASGWTCGTGLMRLDLAPFTGAKSRASLGGGTFTRFLYPASSGGSSSTAYSASQGDITRVQCSSSTSPKYCSLTITGLNEQRLYLRVKSVYINSSLTISGVMSTGSPVEFTNAQVLVDATGKANDVLRRVQVRIPAQQAGILPDGPLNSRDTICKRYIIENNTTLNDTEPCGIN